MKCATVQIKGADGKPVIINKEDFNSETEELYVPAEKKPAEKKPAEKKPE